MFSVLVEKMNYAAKNLNIFIHVGPLFTFVGKSVYRIIHLIMSIVTEMLDLILNKCMNYDSSMELNSLQQTYNIAFH